MTSYQEQINQLTQISEVLQMYGWASNPDASSNEATNPVCILQALAIVVTGDRRDWTVMAYKAPETVKALADTTAKHDLPLQQGGYSHDSVVWAWNDSCDDTRVEWLRPFPESISDVLSVISATKHRLQRAESIQRIEQMADEAVAESMMELEYAEV